MSTIQITTPKHSKSIPLPAKKMHGIVWIMVGVFTAIVASFPLAMLRVSQKPEFSGSHVISVEQLETVKDRQ